ncbi:MAG: hypothetical protein JO035_06870 [Betaproteobacteria bacterium]|nr:hypothetical protein [Betaproteobacteria bacterium]
MEFANALVTFALGVGVACAQPAGAPDAAFAQAAQLAQRAAGGDTSAVEGSIEAFQGLVAQAPANPLYRTYLGMTLSLKGRDAWMPWSKVKYTERGLDEIDRGLGALKPEHDRALMRGVPLALEARLVAARTFLRVPDDIFHRRADGRKLLAQVLADPQFPGAPEGFREAVQRAATEAGLREAGR